LNVAIFKSLHKFIETIDH